MRDIERADAFADSMHREPDELEPANDNVLAINAAFDAVWACRVAYSMLFEHDQPGTIVCLRKWASVHRLVVDSRQAGDMVSHRVVLPNGSVVEVFEARRLS